MDESQSPRLFTILVPVYNVAPYLRECLDSVISQQGEDIEIILVDDGSTDGSGAICGEYAGRDHRITVIHQQNQGVSAARNAGLRLARGRWLLFVDADDLLMEGAVERMRAWAGEKAQLVVFGHEKFDGLRANMTPAREDLVTGERMPRLRRYCLGERNPEFHFPTGTLYSKMWQVDYLREQNLLFESRCRLSQDVLFIFNATRHMTCIHVLPVCVYRYRINPASVTQRFLPDELERQDAFMSCLWRDMRENGEDQNDGLLDAYYKQAYIRLTRCLERGICHPDCPFSREERLAWFQKLCALEWVDRLAARENRSSDKILHTLLPLIRSRDYAGMEARLHQFRRCLHRRKWIKITKDRIICTVRGLPGGGALYRGCRSLLGR